ncbi:MAG: tetratricopeptide repeat protein [Candidatus Hodarchaeota archaeon]
MSNSSPDEFTLVEKLINDGKIEEALEIIIKFTQDAWGLFFRGDFDRALEIALKCKELHLKIGKQAYIADNLYLIGHIHRGKRNFNTSLNYGYKSLEIHKELNNQQRIAASLSLIGLNYWDINDSEQAVKYCLQSLSINEIGPIVKVNNLNTLVAIYTMRGELSQAFIYSEEGFKFATKEKLYNFIPLFMYNLGFISTIKRDYNKAVEYLKNGIAISEKIEVDFDKGLLLLLLTIVYLQIDSYDAAQECVENLKRLADNNTMKYFTYCYSTARGIILKESTRTRDRAEAERLLKQVVDDDTFNIKKSLTFQYFANISVYAYALYFLCDLFIEELGMSNDLGIIDEINPYISKLHEFAEEYESYLFFTEVKIFKARLALIEMNFDKTRMLLTEAQRMAETHDLQFFAQIISNNHDHLLEQQDILEQLKRTNAPISERLKLASFDGVLARMKGRNSTEPPESINEDPVLLLIIEKGGSLVFSKNFSEDLTIESDLISNFLSAFESFGDELFSERLDRIKYGENTILMKSLEKFSICYLFKGQSYLAQKKLTQFTEKIQEEALIWQTLEKVCKTSQILETGDIPLLGSIISKIFSTNNLDLNVEIV